MAWHGTSARGYTLMGLGNEACCFPRDFLVWKQLANGRQCPNLGCPSSLVGAVGEAPQVCNAEEGKRGLEAVPSFPGNSQSLCAHRVKVC
jgi:hypothetical protein